ncbi:MAG: glycerate kinase [Phycisphaerae bacterium]
MKIIIAPDSFKESLTAFQAAKAVESGFKKIFPDAHYDLIPMADGGEGTVQAMIQSASGSLISCMVTGPLGQPVEATFGLLNDNSTAVLEMAAASGLPLVRPDQRNPMFTTTFGTGELIKSALDHGAKKIIIGIGGSATVDGGAGAIQALGAKLLDENGSPIPHGGRGLKKLAKIDLTDFDPRIAQTEILIASDVDNPLTGPKGAARVFGPQKGATPEMIEILDQNLKHYANVIRDQLGIDIESAPGSGAAGGLGAALLAFCRAKLESGSLLVAKTVNLTNRLKNANLCLTGEGQIDSQSVHGKVCHRVAQLAHAQNIPAIALVGSIGKDAHLTIPPLTAYFSLINRPMELNHAIHHADDLLTDLAEQVARTLTLCFPTSNIEH